MDYYYLFLFSIISLIVILVIFLIYIKIRFKFWASQPVFHVYDFGYMLFPPGIIDHHLPEKNKYTNFKQIESLVYEKLSEYKSKQFVNFIKQHYLKNGDNVFSPKPVNVDPYFTSHTSKSFISFYHENEFVADHKNGSLEEFKKIVSVITSRPVHISIWKKEVKNTMHAYYVDYLCVHDDYRKKGIAPQMIQTHHYYQRHMNKNILVGLFKREGELTGIVPICVYKTYGFSVKKWVKPPEFPPYYTLLEINPQNFSSLYDFLKKTAPKYFDIHIHTEITNIIELLKTKNLFIYVLMNNDVEEIKCAYFFRKSCVFIEKDLEVLTCIGSINDSNSNNDFFTHGFKLSFWKIAEKNIFGFAAIENISHNHLLIHNIMKKTKPVVISPTAYFFYNFAYPTFSSNKTWILI